ncbi:MAG: deoxyribodipyrimidine photo-lyase [Hyphomicrobiaceae bacterium]
MKPVIVWFRQDLRLSDNRALAAACAEGAPVVPVYVFDTSAGGRWRAGSASRWWLHGSLASLAASLAARGSRLILRRGDACAVLEKLTQELEAAAVHCTRAYEPWAARQEQHLHARFERRGIAFKRYGGALVFEPEAIRTKAGEPFKVFTPFWRALVASGAPRRPEPAPRRLVAPSAWPQSDALDDWRLLPSKPDWAGGLRSAWTPGEGGAAARLKTFLNSRLARYAGARDRPGLDATSGLSPHLHFGEISPAACWSAAQAAASADSACEAGADVFLRELAWREFSYALLHAFPDMPDVALRPEFRDFPWRTSRSALSAWQRGRTGVPIVDAGMRQLWETGWMHNRVRMIVASFLTKDLLVPWQAGAAWFWDTLVDADLANNSAGWQWVAGCGADAAPYFRIFNPVRQGQTFDPDGDYVRRWVPELSQLPSGHIHAPWLAPAPVLAAAEVVLAKSYPMPVVDHGAARRAALAAYETMMSERRAPERD